MSVHTDWFNICKCNFKQQTGPPPSPISNNITTVSPPPPSICTLSVLG